MEIAKSIIKKSVPVIVFSSLLAPMMEALKEDPKVMRSTLANKFYTTILLYGAQVKIH